MIMELLQPFAISLLIGLAVGIDRERKVREGEGTMGVRTFAILALLGTVAGKIDTPALTGGIMLFLSLVIALSYSRATAPETVVTDESPGASGSARNGKEIGLTTEISAALVFALGYLAIDQRVLAGILGIVLVTTLYSRQYLHFFSRKFLQPADIGAALLLSILAFIVMPSLPAVAVDPWGLVVPRRFMQIMLLIGSTEFLGYLLQRVLGSRIGALATGFLGGLVSSTAVFLTTARKSKREEIPVANAIGIALSATASSMLLTVAVIATASQPLLMTAGMPLFLAAAMVALLGHFAVLRQSQDQVSSVNGHSPISLRRVLALTGVIVGLLTLTALVKRYIGTDAFNLVSFVSGLFELQATIFAASMLHNSKEASLELATQAILYASVASYISKLAIAWALGSARFAMLTSVSLLLSAACALAYWLAVGLF